LRFIAGFANQNSAGALPYAGPEGDLGNISRNPLKPHDCGRKGSRGFENPLPRTEEAAKKVLFSTEGIPKRLKPNSVRRIYVWAEARCGEVARTLQKN
jgi:hypothetical protein